MARDTRNECSRHCIFLESSISLPSQCFACRMSPNESSVQGKYLGISRLATADPAGLGRVSQLCSFQSQALCARALWWPWTAPGHPPSKNRAAQSVSTVPHLDKKHSHTRVCSSSGTQASGKEGNSDGEEEKKRHTVLVSPPNPAMPPEAGPGPQAHPHQDTGVQTYCITYTELCNPWVLINKQRLPQVTSENNLRNPE